MTKAIALFCLLCAACRAGYALGCVELMMQIGQKIEASGVADYALDIVDAAADAPGKVVGSCNSGRSKIVYRKAGASDAPVVPTASDGATRKAGPQKMLTECKPGFSGPDCTERSGSR